ncbi:tetratricopeptide repeat protein [bacterium]|nr:tetratricopeptide repeat protein [bacterium]
MRTPTLVLIAALFLLGLPGRAPAECSPGQMQEAQIQFQNAQQLLQSQQWQQAVPQLESIVQFCDEYFPALRGLGMAHMQLEQFAEAEQAYARVIEVRGGEADAADYFNLARALAKQKKYKEARAEFIKAKARDAENEAVLINLGIMHYVCGYPDDAVVALEEALGYFPEHSERIMPHLAKAAAMSADKHRKLGNTAKARDFEEKATRYGGSAGGTTAYAQIQEKMKAGQYGAVVELCDALLEKDPDHVGAILTKARAADAMRPPRRDVAIAAYERFLELRPDNMNETAALIIVLAEAERCNEAINRAREAVDEFAGMGQKALGKIHFAYGKALFCAEDYAGARAQFSQASNAGDPRWAQAARDGIEACDEYLTYEERRRQAAEQGR